MEFADVVHKRRMTRRYDPSRPVDRDVVDRLVDAGLRAPSAGFSQGWHFLVLDDAPSVQRYWTVTGAAGTDGENAWLSGMRTAPVLIVVYSDRSRYETRYAAPDKMGDHAPADLGQRWPVPYWHLDAAMSALLVQLAAVDAGLACCLFAVPTLQVPALAAAFGVPAGFTPVGVVSVGYPTAAGQTSAQRRVARRERSDVVSYGRFGGSATQQSSG